MSHTYEERRDAVPARHRDALDSGHLNDLPTLAEVERRILEVDSALGERVEDLYRLSEYRAEAESRWEEHLARTVVDIVNSGNKGAKDIREAIAMDRISRDGIPGEELHRAKLLHEASESTCQAHMRALMSRLSALQTLHRGLSHVTGLS